MTTISPPQHLQTPVFYPSDRKRLDKPFQLVPPLPGQYVPPVPIEVVPLKPEQVVPPGVKYDNYSRIGPQMFNVPA